MRKYNLVAQYVKKARTKHKNERIEENIKPNLLKRNFTTDMPNKLWDTDVTYLIFKGSRSYLSTIIDLYDRKVIVYKISKHNDNKLVIDTLNEAILKRKDVYGLILHFDQGFQYASNEYKAVCQSNGIIISMSRKGNSMDNGMMENFFGILKTEMFYDQEDNYKTLDDLIKAIDDYIYYYNYDRIKDKLKGLSHVNYRLQSSN